MTLASIPASRAQLSIPLNDLPRLPVGSSYFQASGQARLSARLVNDTVYLEAVCDSLARQVEIYEAQLSRTRSETETRLKIEEKPSVQTAFKWSLIGVFIGSAITILITRTLKKISYA
jgi:hypothetical protein